MPDREKVIKALEFCTDQRIVDTCYGECPYAVADDDYKCLQMKLDALALLKEQEAVAPEVEVLNELDRLYRCPRCHKCFFYEHQKFCDQCGQAVKWE